MKVRIIEQTATVYSEPDSSSLPINQLAVGNEIEMGGIKKRAGKSWVAVQLPGNQRGYLPGDTRIYHIKRVKLNQKAVEVHSDPSAQSMVTSRYGRGGEFLLADTVERDGKSWVKIRDAAGGEGFIDGKTQIKVIPEVTKSVGKKNMLYGALWCVGGTVVTVVSYTAVAESGGTYIVAWGAILFGAIQFIKGVYQFSTAPA
jgi:hypothetical protein